jgi:UDP-glucose 4-epimerase
MEILVTGSSGYIGSHLKKSLIDDGHDVVEWDLKIGKNIKDITTYDIRSTDAVVHLAAFADVRKSMNDPDVWYQNNVDYSTKIFNYATPWNVPVIYASSSCAKVWWKSAYGMSKKALESVAIADGKHIGLRFTNVFGETGCRESMLIPKMISKTLEYKTSMTRDFIHVLDVVDAIKLFLYRKSFREEHTQHVYDVCSGVGRRVNEIVDKYYYKDVPLTKGDPIESDDNTGNPTDLMNLGWMPKRDLDKYLEEKLNGDTKLENNI